MMQKKKTIYHLILDKSGSMRDCLENTISGFNEQQRRIRGLEAEFPDQTISSGLTIFNDAVEFVAFDTALDNAPTLNINNYQPSGTTALYDAIGFTCMRIEELLQSQHDHSSTVVLVILTDGYENSSVSFNLGQIRQLISRLEATGNWTFSFIGATLDAVEVASSLSIKRQNSFAFDKSELRESVWNKVTNGMKDYMSAKKNGKSGQDLFGEE